MKNLKISYRQTINTAEQIKKAGIFKPKQVAEPCIFVYKFSRQNDNIKDINREYFIKKYNYTDRSGKKSESALLTKIKLEEIRGMDIYLIREYPLATDFEQWELYRKAKKLGDYQKAEEIMNNIILPEKGCLRGIGITLKLANWTARKIAKRRANEIAKKINFPVLDEIILLNE